MAVMVCNDIHHTFSAPRGGGGGGPKTCTQKRQHNDPLGYIHDHEQQMCSYVKRLELWKVWGGKEGGECKCR